MPAMRFLRLALVAVALGPCAASAAPPRCASIAAFTVDPPPPRGLSPNDPQETHQQSLETLRADLCRVLDAYHEVTPQRWQDNHHVAGRDRTGTITLKDGSVLRWLMRPGGLATLTRADGVTIFLSRQR